jgi:hypothetical protein
MNHQANYERENEQHRADFWERMRVRHYRHSLPSRPVPVTNDSEVDAVVEDVAEQ